MPTGTPPPSTTNSAVIFDELMICSAALAASGRNRLGRAGHDLTRSTRLSNWAHVPPQIAVREDAERLPSSPAMPRQPKLFSVITTSAVLIGSSAPTTGSPSRVCMKSPRTRSTSRASSTMPSSSSEAVGSVEHHDVGVVEKGSRQSHALALPHREPIDAASGQRSQAQRIERSLMRSTSLGTAQQREPRPESHVVVHGQSRIQARGGRRVEADAPLEGCAVGLDIQCPSWMRPRSGRIRPAAIRSSVVLPTPLGPLRCTTLACSTTRLTSSSTARSAPDQRFVTP